MNKNLRVRLDGFVKIESMNKAYTLVKKHCANHLDNGLCNGININPSTGEQFRFLPEGTRCLVACGGRCKYFEWAVLKDPNGGKPFVAARKQYRRMCAEKAHDFTRERTCPDCDTAIGPRQRYCTYCAEYRRTATMTKAQRKWRQKRV